MLARKLAVKKFIEDNLSNVDMIDLPTQTRFKFKNGDHATYWKSDHQITFNTYSSCPIMIKYKKLIKNINGSKIKAPEIDSDPF